MWCDLLDSAFDDDDGSELSNEGPDAPSVP